jgi:vacuolar-type H+-ATPase subunit E/Vma4
MTDTTTETSKADAARAAAQDTAQEAAAQGRDVAATAAEKGQEVASSAVEQAREVASVASEQAASVGSQAIGQARTVLDSATGDVRDQLEQRLRTLSEQARSTAEELQALVDGRPEDAGRTRDLAQSASDHIGRLADRADELGVQGVVEEVTDLARRRPVLFLAGAATAGILVGRMARAGKEVQSGSQADAVGPGGAEATTPGWGETGLAAAPPIPAPVPAAAPRFDPAPLPPPAVPGTDPGGSASGWVGS